MTGSRLSLTGTRRSQTSTTRTSSPSSSVLLPGTTHRCSGPSQTRSGVEQPRTKMAAGSPPSMFATTDPMVTLLEVRCTSRVQLAQPVDKDLSVRLSFQDFAVSLSISLWCLRISSLSVSGSSPPTSPVQFPAPPSNTFSPPEQPAKQPQTTRRPTQPTTIRFQPPSQPTRRPIRPTTVRPITSTFTNFIDRTASGLELFNCNFDDQENDCRLT